mgnify:CR=1 FL=1
MLPSLRHLVVSSPEDETVTFRDLRSSKRMSDASSQRAKRRQPAISDPDETSTIKRNHAGAETTDSETIDCGEAEELMVFRANPRTVNANKKWCLGARMQMPGMDITSDTCSIACTNMEIILKIATLKTKLAYSNEQLLFHASTDRTLKDDGHFRYFAFDASHSANYANEECARRHVNGQFLHVFRVKKEIPNLALFADTDTWAVMSGRSAMLNEGKCDPTTLLGERDAETKEARQIEATSLGMPFGEYEWSERIREFQTSTGVPLNGFISTTALSATEPYIVMEAKFELMLNVDKLSDFLEHVGCFKLVDYVGKVEYKDSTQQ